MLYCMLWCEMWKNVLWICESAKSNVSLCNHAITKSYLYSFDPLKPHFYIVKLGLQGYALFFLYMLENINCGYSLEPPRRGGSNEYPQSTFWTEIWKISELLSVFLVVKLLIYLNRHVFVMNIITAFSIAPDKREYPHIFFLISPRKHTSWLLFRSAFVAPLEIYNYFRLRKWP